ncbi:MAG: transposase [Magnetococcales bacterium]|nr:transposase [Magnetococcales bacterium]
MGFWEAVKEIFPTTRFQRCWVHKTANVLNKPTKSLQTLAKKRIHDICIAPTKEEAEEAFDFFLKSYGAKYHKVTECLKKGRENLLTFYDFPAEYWRHLRTTNPIDSTYATVKLRTAKTWGCLSRETGLSMVYQLCRAAERKWQRLHEPKRLADVVKGVKFVNGEVLEKKAA